MAHVPFPSADRETHVQIVLFSVLLVLVTIAPVLLRLLGPVYLVQALILNGVFLWQAVEILRNPTNAHTWRPYGFSLLHLALFFFAMGVDYLFYQGLGLAGDVVLRLPW